LGSIERNDEVARDVVIPACAESNIKERRTAAERPPILPLRDLRPTMMELRSAMGLVVPRRSECECGDAEEKEKVEAG